MCVVPPDVLYWTLQGQHPRLSSARVPRNFRNRSDMCMLVRRGVSPQTIDTLRLHQMQSETTFSMLPYVREVGVSGGVVGVQAASAYGSTTSLCCRILDIAQASTRPDQTSPLSPRAVKEEMPLFVQFMEVLAPSLPWIARKLSCPMELLFTWKPPSHSKFNLARGLFVKEIAGSDFFGPSIFVDAAWDKFGYRVGGVVPKRGVRSWVVQSPVHNQQEAKLQGVAWAVRVACRFG